MKPLLLTIALLFSTPAWAENPKQVIMICENYTFDYPYKPADGIPSVYRFTKGFFYNSIDWRPGGWGFADWLKWPENPNEPEVDSISIILHEAEVLDYTGRSVYISKLTSDQGAKEFNNFRPAGKITTVITTLDFMLLSRIEQIKDEFPDGTTKTKERRYSCKYPFTSDVSAPSRN